MPFDRMTDSKLTWDWATLTGDTWIQHGKLVAAATQYFPPSFHRPPRNPAEKISSGYKATEWYLYIFGLGPGFFRTFLPRKYWRNFCKLVHGIRGIIQQRISGKQVREAHSSFIQFVEEHKLALLPALYGPYSLLSAMYSYPTPYLSGNHLRWTWYLHHSISS